jgi:hypothetical protein
MSSWTKPMRGEALGAGCGVAAGVHTVEHAYAGDVALRKASPPMATSATAARPRRRRVRFRSRKVGW